MMVRIFVLTIIIFVSMMSCRAVKIPCDNIEWEWKKAWIDMFYKEYIYNYQKNILPHCDNMRDPVFDIRMKMMRIGDYPFEQHYNFIQLYIKKKDIKFDTLILETSYMSHDDHWYHPTKTYVYIQNKDKLDEIIVELNENDFSVNQLPKSNFTLEELYGVKSECGYGYISYTKVDKNWNWKIAKIVINPLEFSD